VASRYEPQLRLCVEGGKLIEADKWGNVARHCFVQASATEEMATLLRLGAHELTRLARTAASHDWRKRLEKCRSDFTDEEIDRADRLCAEGGPDTELMRALNPYFLPIFFSGAATMLQMVQFYIDDITRDDEIVRFEDRIADNEERDPNPEPEVDRILGRPYWDAERVVGHAVESLLFSILKGFDVKLARPQDIPVLIASRMAARVR